MRNFILCKKKMCGIILSSILFVNGFVLSGCTKKNKADSGSLITDNYLNNNSKNSNDINDLSASSNIQKSNIVDEMNTKLELYFPLLSPQVINNASIVMLLPIIAAEDSNGKISSQEINKYKAKIDVDNMINSYDAFLNELENEMVVDGNFISISNILNSSLSNDIEVLTYLENITKNIMELSKNNVDKDQIELEYDKMYNLFVKEDIVDDINIRSLNYTSRAIASVYARVCLYYSREYISQEKIDKMDARTNEQNNKAYIKTILEILKNEIDEVSKIDTISVFNNKYNSVIELLNGKVNLNDESTKNLVNYLNLTFLNSDIISTSDKNIIMGDYTEQKMSDVLLSIDSIIEYNLLNQENIILFSSFLVDDYLKTENGKIDSCSLDYVLYNSIMSINNIDVNADSNSIISNKYFNALYLYLTKQNFVQEYSNSTQTKIIWQEISDSANLVSNEMIYYTINKLPNNSLIEDYNLIAMDNLSSSIQFVQNTILGECKKVDIYEYIKK